MSVGSIAESCEGNMAAEKTHRVETIDFWRGLVLIAILCDHVPGNLIDKATPRNFGLSDSAEAFVFLSGFSVGLAYYRKAVEADWPGVTRRCFDRALRIYGVHIALTLTALVVFAAAYAVCAAPSLIESDGRAFVFHSPLQGGLGVALLTQQLGYFNILPMYVVLMLMSPAILALARISAPLALGASIAIYLAARFCGLTLPNWPEPGAWFFNPFAWQLIFTMGILSCVLWRPSPPAYSRGLYAISILGLLLSAIVVTDAGGLATGLRDWGFAHFDIPKQNLGLGRLTHFLMLAYVIAETPRLAALAKTAFGQSLQRLGRHSLAVFALGSVLSCVGQALVRVAEAQFSFAPAVVGLLYTVFGVIGLFLFARYLEWNNLNLSRRAPPAEDSFSAASPALLRASSSLSRLVHLPWR
jgi:hypothetical protein